MRPSLEAESLICFISQDLAYGDGLISNICSIALGLTIIAITRIFNLPLAEWKRRPDDDD